MRLVATGNRGGPHPKIHWTIIAKLDDDVADVSHAAADASTIADQPKTPASAVSASKSRTESELKAELKNERPARSAGYNIAQTVPWDRYSFRSKAVPSVDNSLTGQNLEISEVARPIWESSAVHSWQNEHDSPWRQPSWAQAIRGMSVLLA